MYRSCRTVRCTHHMSADPTEERSCAPVVVQHLAPAAPVGRALCCKDLDLVLAVPTEVEVDDADGALGVVLQARGLVGCWLALVGHKDGATVLGELQLVRQGTWAADTQGENSMLCLS